MKRREMKAFIVIVSLFFFVCGCGAHNAYERVYGQKYESQSLPPQPYAQPTPFPRMHPSWDQDGDGINDCERDGSCDHRIDYSKPRY